MKRILLATAAFAFLATACGDSDGGLADDPVLTQQGDANQPDNSGDSGSNADSTSGGSDNSGNGTDPGGDGPDNEDAAEIIGNPDLDLEDLPPDIADALDDIDDIVSIGDCRSETVGLEMSFVPDGWKCRVLDQPVGGLDGFTLFMDNNPGGIEITIGTPSPLGPPCEVFGDCDTVEELDLGNTFDVFVLDVGVPLIYGTHKTVEAELSVVTFSALSDADIAFITEVLNGVVVL